MFRSRKARSVEEEVDGVMELWAEMWFISGVSSLAEWSWFNCFSITLAFPPNFLRRLRPVRVEEWDSRTASQYQQVHSE